MMVDLPPEDEKKPISLTRTEKLPCDICRLGTSRGELDLPATKRSSRPCSGLIESRKSQWTPISVYHCANAPRRIELLVRRVDESEGLQIRETLHRPALMSERGWLPILGKVRILSKVSVVCASRGRYGYSIAHMRQDSNEERLRGQVGGAGWWGAVRTNEALMLRQGLPCPATISTNPSPQQKISRAAKYREYLRIPSSLGIRRW
ncbi:hypothetical protein LX36DRAFT_344258 [Colletotrichum falcatum]|nr:hypothetical protein LX36DRAFT_344258 [Colletotrichum falcatum]